MRAALVTAAQQCTALREMAAAAGNAEAPPPWPEQLRLRLDEADAAVKALLAVCRQPEARAALEVRALVCDARARAQRTARVRTACTALRGL